MADEGELAPDGSPVDPEIVSEDDSPAVHDRDEAGAGAQEGGLAGTVGAGQEHDLADPDVEVDAREGREASEQADGGSEVDGEAHASDPRLPGGGSVPPRHPGPRRRLGLASILSVTGRTLIALGLLLLGFVGFELVGTNVAEARNQESLKDQLTVPPPPVDLPISQPTQEPAPPPPPIGSAVAQIRIPRIGLDKAVVEGVALSDLRKGPGHYSHSPMPGQPGNAAIAGHRTTYGAPFFRLDEMKPGDPIFVSTTQGAFRYEVREAPGRPGVAAFVVKPSEVEVISPTEDARLTLTTCNPRFSAAQRLVVVADLKGPAAPGTTLPSALPSAPNVPVAAGEAAEPPPIDTVAGASGDPAERLPSALWGTVVLTLGIAGAVLGRLWRRWPAWILTAVPFLPALWTFYSHLAKAVPS